MQQKPTLVIVLVLLQVSSSCVEAAPLDYLLEPRGLFGSSKPKLTGGLKPTKDSAKNGKGEAFTGKKGAKSNSMNVNDKDRRKAVSKHGTGAFHDAGM